MAFQCRAYDGWDRTGQIRLSSQVVDLAVACESYRMLYFSGRWRFCVAPLMDWTDRPEK
jgi:hypothetical protein